MAVEINNDGVTVYSAGPVFDIWGGYVYPSVKFVIVCLIAVFLAKFIHKKLDTFGYHTRLSLSFISFTVIFIGLVGERFVLASLPMIAFPFIAFCMFLDQRDEHRKNQ